MWWDGEFLQKERFPRTIAALERAIAAGLRLHPFQDLTCGIYPTATGAYDGALGVIVGTECALTVDNETRQ